MHDIEQLTPDFLIKIQKRNRKKRRNNNNNNAMLDGMLSQSHAVYG